MLQSSPFRSIVRIDKAHIENIYKDEWLCINKSGKGIIMSTLPGHSITPTDGVLFALGTCSADDVKIGLEEKGFKVNKVSAFLDGEIDKLPKRRLRDIKIRFEVDGDSIPAEKVKEVAIDVINRVCPVANTLVSQPKIIAKAKVIKPK